MVIKPVIIIPCYRHGAELKKNLRSVRKLGIPVVIVDDGNPVPLSEQLKGELDGGISVLRTERNGGKGCAMKHGFRQALEAGYTHALQIDADFQQDLQAVPEFFRLADQNPDALISGSPVYSNVPAGRFLARYVTHFWVAVELGRCRLVDSMCGIRVYPLERTCRIMNARNVGSHMSFDTEIMIRLYWNGCDIITCPVKVIYHEGGISNFRALRDNLEISLCHTRLCVEKVLHPFKTGRRTYL